MSVVIRWTIDKREQLRKRYQEAVNNKEHVFTFEHHPFLTTYTKYLLEYLDSVLDENKRTWITR